MPRRRGDHRTTPGTLIGVLLALLFAPAASFAQPSAVSAPQGEPRRLPPLVPEFPIKLEGPTPPAPPSPRLLYEYRPIAEAVQPAWEPDDVPPTLRTAQGGETLPPPEALKKPTPP